MKNIVTQLQTIRRQQQQLSEEETRLLTPLLTDISELETVYAIFKNLTHPPQPGSRTENVAQRKKFLFIALCFFAPGTLAGKRVPHGLRNRLAKVLHIYPTFISHNIENVMFNYQNVKAEREELEYLYSVIENELISLGKIDTPAYKSVQF